MGYLGVVGGSRAYKSDFPGTKRKGLVIFKQEKLSLEAVTQLPGTVMPMGKAGSIGFVDIICGYNVVNGDNPGKRIVFIGEGLCHKLTFFHIVFRKDKET